MTRNCCVAILCLLLFACQLPGYAQNSPVTRKKNLFGFYKYHKAGQKLSEKEFLEVLQPYPQSYNLMRTARKNFIWGSIIGSAGMIITLSQLNPPYFDRKINPAIIIPGVALLGISLPLSFKYVRQSGLALDLYNEAQLKTGSFRPKAEFRLDLTRTGFGLGFQF